jgi:hypothetical protein
MLGGSSAPSLDVSQAAKPHFFGIAAQSDRSTFDSIRAFCFDSRSEI